MPLYDRVLDNGLTVLDTEANRLDICSQAPTMRCTATDSGAAGETYVLTASIGVVTA